MRKNKSKATAPTMSSNGGRIPEVPSESAGDEALFECFRLRSEMKSAITELR